MQSQTNELKYYSSIKNWDFEDINYEEEYLTNWKFFEKISELTNKNSLCLDIGTGGGEKVLRNYPNVGMIIATDFSKEMISTAKENLKKYKKENVKFCVMDNVKMTFPDELFDLISARHTVINVKEIYRVLRKDGYIVIEGIHKNDCQELKDLFGGGQGYHDEESISEQDYKDLINAGFSKVNKVIISINEYYKSDNDLMALLLKTPILDDFEEGSFEEHIKSIDIKLFNEYVKKFKTEKGILLKRVLYGIIAQK
ncbi:S-adenosyl-L-methionine-dependent methyltransferase [Anaeromyces robustus]|uniref:S-adenosyl-L-methionine-dependent methyltransferase n=1 Tax=Anaeromyces robustus TaxID=1754192 RepID=A0A1Y1XPS1_9FUNG|nr:S-adenosyl-L-methionine-dependent methyltransferase [Anaeromyces robustus]|eukprot:ORX87750.1 S-adenosyl-L-methionine-dependent methyltransferase [Anaeromyces robustus]